jgi:hypothetical protein
VGGQQGGGADGLLCLAAAGQVFSFMGLFWPCACLAVFGGGQKAVFGCDGVFSAVVVWRVLFVFPRAPACDHWGGALWPGGAGRASRAGCVATCGVWAGGIGAVCGAAGVPRCWFG